MFWYTWAGVFELDMFSSNASALRNLSRLLICVDSWLTKINYKQEMVIPTDKETKHIKDQYLSHQDIQSMKN